MKVKLTLLIIGIIAISINGFTQNNKPRFTVYGAADTVYITPEVMPKFSRGDEGLLEYLDEIAFPLFFIEHLVLAKQGDWEGTVHIEFIINKDGTVSNAAISSSTGYGTLDTAALQHVQGMPKWKPGKQNGKPVKVQMVLPVKFYYYHPPPPPPPPPSQPYDETAIVDETDGVIEEQPTEVIFKIVEEMPEFPGGEQALWKYMSQTVYPDQARLDKLQGTVYVEFLIGKDGAISNVRIVRSSNHPILDESAKNQVANMPNWTPGKQNGKPVIVQYVVPVKFKL